MTDNETSGKDQQLPDMPNNSLCGGLCLFFIFWIILAPFVIIFYILTLPFKCCIKRPKPDIEMAVEITEAKGEMVDEILLIHGFPDDVRMWDKTVPALAE